MCATCGCMGKKKPAKKSTAKKSTLSPKQKMIAGKADPKGKITGADFKAMKKKK